MPDACVKVTQGAVSFRGLLFQSISFIRDCRIRVREGGRKATQMTAHFKMGFKKWVHQN